MNGVLCLIGFYVNYVCLQKNPVFTAKNLILIVSIGNYHLDDKDRAIK